jgi:hypothetical protein
MAITANTCRVCSERFLFGRGQGYAHDLCSLDCERDELNAKAQSLQRRCKELAELVQAFRSILRHKEIRPPMNPGVQEQLEQRCADAISPQQSKE